VSDGGSSPSAACSAASAAFELEKAVSAALARTGFEATPVSAILAVEPSTTAAAPTTAQSCARRLNLTYALLAAFGTRAAVRISSAESDVWR
jgi:hypothetical protein